MRNWVLKKLNGIDRSQYMRLYAQYLDAHAEWNKTIEKFEMQHAWEQVKQERKARRLN